MTDAKARYQSALTAFAVPGNRWSGVLPLTYWAVLAGLEAEDILHDAHRLGVCDRDVDIRRGVLSAKGKILTGSTSFRICPEGHPHKRPRACQSRQQILLSTRVRQLISIGSGTTGLLQLRNLSPVTICPDHDKLALRVQTELHLLSMFGPSDIVHVFSPDCPSVGKPGKNLRPVGEWLTDPAGAHPDLAGEIVRPNPFSGFQGTTRDGKPSYIAQTSLADFRHMVFEFDGMPLETQCQFWAGFIAQSALPLVSLVYSGNKSIHGVIRVNAPDVATWNSYRNRLITLFSSDAEKSYRLDPQALHPLTGTRLAGIKRRSTGKLQELLWVRSDWFDQTYQAKFNKTRDIP